MVIVLAVPAIADDAAWDSAPPASPEAPAAAGDGRSAAASMEHRFGKVERMRAHSNFKGDLRFPEIRLHKKWKSRPP